MIAAAQQPPPLLRAHNLRWLDKAAGRPPAPAVEKPTRAKREAKPPRPKDPALSAAIMLLRRAHSALAQMQRLHIASVTIGRMERITESGVADAEIAEARQIIESADLLSADIDKLFPRKNQP